jgi:26S proteasome regulatory subunit N1
VPKPLKFLRSHYGALKEQYDQLPSSNPNKAQLADVISVLAITSGKEGARESLKFRCTAHTQQQAVDLTAHTASL